MEHSRDGSQHWTDERFNTASSIVGSIIALLFCGLIAGKLLDGTYEWPIFAATGVYLAGLVNLFVMSALHHGVQGGARSTSVFRTLDYTAIFWLIASTVSALVVLSTPGIREYGVAIATWTVAAAGIALRASMPRLPKYITNTLYISLGWLPAMVLLPLLRGLGPFELVLLISGGLLYSVGFAVYVLERPNPVKGVFGFHEIWHSIVIIASTLHALLVYSLL